MRAGALCLLLGPRWFAYGWRNYCGTRGMGWVNCYCVKSQGPAMSVVCRVRRGEEEGPFEPSAAAQYRVRVVEV
jgi:hypothetical protein